MVNLKEFVARVLKIQVVDLELTNRCNLACSICPRGMKRPVGDMSDETFRTLFSEPLPRTVKGVRLCGYGEPLLHSDLFARAATIRQNNPRIDLDLSTNGVLLNADNAARLVAAGIDTVHISIPGPDPESFCRITGIPDMDTTAANVRSMVAAKRGEKPRVVIHSTIVDESRHQVPAARKFFRALGADAVEFFHCHNRGGHLDGEAPARDGRTAWGRPCQVARNITFVTWEGMALLCAQDIHGAYVRGDLATEGWDKVLARTLDSAGMGGRQAICARCNDDLRTRMFVSGRDKGPVGNEF